MGLTRIQAPATDFVTLEEALAHCRVTTDVEAGLVQGYVFAARELVENDTGRAFITQKWALTLDNAWPTIKDRDTGRDQKRIVLPKPPIQSVDSITYFDSSGVQQTLAPSQYLVTKADTGEWVVDQATGATWPLVTKRAAFATINFTAGYGDNPGDVPELARQAVLLLVAQWYDYRLPIATAQAIQELPYGTDQLITRLRANLYV
jgi:uncharacterized phiE125 gp8 family phage protein